MSETTTQTGVEAVAAMFAAAKAQNRAAFLPYYMIGYRSYEESIDVIEAMAREGVDGFEIGLPFSDPLADGPVNQAAAQVALANGMTTARCLDAVRELRRRGVTQPFLLMGYINPILSYGIDNFVRDLREAGANGLIVPDMPLEESWPIAAACAREGLAIVTFIAPTSGLDRARMACETATGFVYVLTVIGITGARADLPPDLTDFIHGLRTVSGDTRLVLGFGISTPEQARRVASIMDGFIVGSALVRAGAGGVEPVRALASSLRAAL
jgi:tryptophan synthase alpha chain